MMMDIGSFHCPEPMFISRGATQGNKNGQGGMVSACVPCRVFLVVSVSASHTVGRGFAPRSGHTKYHHKI